MNFLNNLLNLSAVGAGIFAGWLYVSEQTPLTLTVAAIFGVLVVGTILLHKDLA